MASIHGVTILWRTLQLLDDLSNRQSCVCNLVKLNAIHFLLVHHTVSVIDISDPVL